jgi:hypothetical protein
MTQTSPITLLVLLCLGVAANAADGDCDSFGGLDFICGPQNAEDLVAVPGTRWIVTSAMTDGAAILLIDSRDKTWSKLYPSDSSRIQHDANVYGACPGAPNPATLITHGLNIRAAENGHSTLYAVAHGDRETIEVFDVDASGAKPVLTWKGCVLMPEGLAANSVASFSDGSLVATVLILPGRTFTDAMEGKLTGAVYKWAPGNTDFELVRGAELSANNGIEVSADDREFFVVSSGLHTIVAFSNSNPARQLRTTRQMAFTPDNVHMAPDGRLVTAGMIDDVPACGGAPSPQHDLAMLAACPRGFFAVAVDPQTMRDTLIAQGSANPNFSNATMVLPIGNEFWIGTFSGDRIGYGTLE